MLKWSTYQHKASQYFEGGALIYLYFPVCEWFYFLPNLGHLKCFKFGQNYQMWVLSHLLLATRFMMFPRWAKWFSGSRPFLSQHSIFILILISSSISDYYKNYPKFLDHPCQGNLLWKDYVNINHTVDLSWYNWMCEICSISSSAWVFCQWLFGQILIFAGVSIFWMEQGHLAHILACREKG